MVAEFGPCRTRRVLIVGLTCLFLFAAAPAVAQTTPSSDGGELIRSKSELIGYGAEVARLVNEPDEIVSLLRNGTTVIVKRIPSPAVSVRGYCATGGIYEGRWLGGGLSHLLEHLVAGGSSDRRDEAQNKALLERIGNDSNAYTTEDHTAFFVNTTVDHMDEAVDLVTGWMLGAKITVPEYRREYEVVQRELERNKGVPDQVFWQLMQTNRYHVSPMRVPVIGYQEVIQGLSRDDVYSYYKLAYQPNNMVFVVVGDIDPQQMLASVQKNVADAKPGRVFSHDITPEPPVLAPRTLVATFPKLGPARVDLSFPSVKEDSPDMYALDMLAAIHGGSESSILTEDLRDDRQLVTAIGCGDWTPSYVEGSFQVDFQSDPDKVQPAISAILADLATACDKGVDPARLARAKTETRMARLRQMQTSQDVAASLATDYLDTGDVHFSDHYVDRIAAVTPEQIQAVAKKYLDPRRLVTTVLLPSEYVGSGGLPKAEDLLRPAVATSSPQIAAAPKTVQRSLLSNGTVLLVKRFTHTPLVTVRMFSLGGVTAEDAKTNGLGNLTMVMLRRGAGGKSARQLAEYFDSIGAEIGTSCGNNTWSWTLTCAKEDLPAALAAYSDIVLHPTFAGDQAAAMKQRIAAQIAAQDSDWHNRAFRYFKKEFFGPSNSPYQFMPVGTLKNVQTFTTDQMSQWYTQKILTAPRVLAIFGDVDPQQAQQMADSLLGGGEKIPGPVAEVASDAKLTSDTSTPFLNVTKVSILSTDQGPASVIIGFNSDSVIGESAEATTTRAATLAGGFSYPDGYIFHILRGLGLSYEAASYVSPGRAPRIPGSVIAYAACDPSKVNQVTDLLLLNMARLQGSDADIQTDWFGRSADLITTADALEHETPEAQAEQGALTELFGLGYNYHDRFGAQINAVTIDAVRNFARTRLRDCVVTICTPDPTSVTVAEGKREYTVFPAVDLTPKGIQLDTGAPR